MLFGVVLIGLPLYAPCFFFFFQLYLLMFYLFYKVSVYYVAVEFSFQVNVCGVLKGSCTFICISFFRLGKSSFC